MQKDQKDEWNQIGAKDVMIGCQHAVFSVNYANFGLHRVVGRMVNGSRYSHSSLAPW